MSVCSIEGCELRAKARLLCDKHYTRLKRNGDPNIVKIGSANTAAYARSFIRRDKATTLLRRENRKEYTSWKSMRTRCNNPKRHNYHNYGGRGIKVCERWAIFENFLEDMGKKPSSKYSLDRIDNNGNYEPDNCRWATWSEQAHNRRNNVILKRDSLGRIKGKNV